MKKKLNNKELEMISRMISKFKYRYKEFNFPYKRYMEKHRCIFIHIPKAAGTSVLDALGKKDVGGRDHLPWYVYNKANPVKYREYYKFAFVRNPWTRAYSAYNYIMRGGNMNIDLLIKEHLETYQDFDDFVINGLGEGKFRSLPLFIPQCQFVMGFDQKLAVDFVGKFENIENDFLVVSDRLGLKTSLPKKNMSVNKYPVYKKRESIEIIRDIYRQDIAVFDYNYEE